MHCPESVNGNEYIALVAAISMSLAKNLNARDTFILAEFLQNVSYQLFTLGAFKEFDRRNDH